MEGVEFEDTNYELLPQRAGQRKEGGIIAWLIARKFAPNAEQATRFLIGLTVTALVAAVAIWWFGSPKEVEIPRGFENKFITMPVGNR